MEMMMKCEKCGMLYGNMKDDGVIVNPHLGNLCIHCWMEKRIQNNGGDKWWYGDGEKEQ